MVDFYFLMVVSSRVCGTIPMELCGRVLGKETKTADDMLVGITGYWIMEELTKIRLIM